MATNVQRAEHSAARLGRGSQSQKSDVGWCPDKGDGSPYRQEVALERQVPISNQVLEFYPCFTCLPPSGLFLFGDLHVFIHPRARSTSACSYYFAFGDLGSSGYTRLSAKTNAKNPPASPSLTFSGMCVVVWSQTPGILFVGGLQGSARAAALSGAALPVWSLADGQPRAELPAPLPVAGSQNG